MEIADKKKQAGLTRIFDRDAGLLLRDFLELSRTVTADEFKETAMGRLRDVLPFDMGVWASCRTNDLHVHNHFSFNLPEGLLETWEAHKHEDRLLAGMVEQPGTTLDIFDFMSREYRHKLDIYREHSRHYGIENAIATALPDPLTGLLDIMSLYRKDAGRSFSNEERQLKQFVFPLLIDLWRHNQILHLGRASGGAVTGAAAIVDDEGWLRQIDVAFARFLRSEWPEWTGPILPEPVAFWLRKGAREDFRCGQVILNAETVDDLQLLRIRDRVNTDSLTPRELMIAEIYVSGKTSPSIAGAMNISPSTVRRHLESVYRKLGVRSKIELLRALSET
jgi:DNA-binding CsgD family transcriptional regulator